MPVGLLSPTCRVLLGSFELIEDSQIEFYRLGAGGVVVTYAQSTSRYF